MEPQITLDDTTIKELGLEGLPEDAQRDAVAKFYVALKNRFGGALAEKLSAEKLDEFAGVLETNNAEKIREWMDANVPDHQDIFDQQLAELKDDIHQMIQQAEATQNQ